MKSNYCIECGRLLSSDEAALYKKLVNRGATEFSCINCLAAHFSVSVGLLRGKIEQFRADGCTLFEVKNMRYLGVDSGDVRTGIAVSDETNTLACGIGYIKEPYRPKLAEKIREYVIQYGITTVVLGNPVNMNGSRGASSEKAAAFADTLREVCGVEVVLFDERRTTMSAKTYLDMCDVRGKKRKETVDTLSASIILQDYMDSLKNNYGK